MARRIVRSSAFLADWRGFARYCAAYDLHFAETQIQRLTFAVDRLIGDSPLAWAFFVHTGEPYRAYLFRAGRRTQFWIVYSVEEDDGTINLLRLWNAARDPRRFSV